MHFRKITSRLFNASWTLANSHSPHRTLFSYSVFQRQCHHHEWLRSRTAPDSYQRTQDAVHPIHTLRRYMGYTFRYQILRKIYRLISPNHVKFRKGHELFFSKDTRLGSKLCICNIFHFFFNCLDHLGSIMVGAIIIEIFSIISVPKLWTLPIC